MSQCLDLIKIEMAKNVMNFSTEISTFTNVFIYLYILLFTFLSFSSKAISVVNCLSLKEIA